MAIVMMKRNAHDLPDGNDAFPQRICFWTVMPNHYQRSFYQALRRLGVEVHVIYLNRVNAARSQMGWNVSADLPAGEFYCENGLSPLDRIPRWEHCLHIMTAPAIMQKHGVIKRLQEAGAPWAYWDERGRPGLRWWLRYPGRRMFATKLNRHALGAFAIGQAAIDDFTRWGVERDKIALLPYACDPLDSAAPPDAEIAAFAGKQTTFLYCGVLNRRKGIDVLIDAFSRLKPAHAKACLILVGPDASGGLYQRQCRDLHLEDHVLFRGPVAPELLARMMVCADVVVLPSRFDGWGVVLNEAASLGKALIATEDCGAAYHLIQSGFNGYRVNPGDAAHLAAALRHYLASPDLIQLHGNRSREIYDQYCPGEVAKSLLANLSRWWSKDCERPSVKGKTE